MFDRSNEQVRCGQCRWSGALDEAGIEMVIDGVGHRCPACQQLLRIPERLAPRRRRGDRFAEGIDDLAGSPFRSMRIPHD
jgi:hypothetical protein